MRSRCLYGTSPVVRIQPSGCLCPLPSNEPPCRQQPGLARRKQPVLCDHYTRYCLITADVMLHAVSVGACAKTQSQHRHEHMGPAQAAHDGSAQDQVAHMHLQLVYHTNTSFKASATVCACLTVTGDNLALFCWPVCAGCHTVSLLSLVMRGFPARQVAPAERTTHGSVVVAWPPWRGDHIPARLWHHSSHSPVCMICNKHKQQNLSRHRH